MNFKFNILMAILFLNYMSKTVDKAVIGNCRSGCLKCNLQTKICEVCDYKRNYFMKNGICYLKNRLNNC